jgi:hypothetical protein
MATLTYIEGPCCRSREMVTLTYIEGPCCRSREMVTLTYIEGPCCRSREKVTLTYIEGPCCRSREKVTLTYIEGPCCRSREKVTPRLQGSTEDPSTREWMTWRDLGELPRLPLTCWHPTCGKWSHLRSHPTQSACVRASRSGSAPSARTFWNLQ